MLWIFSCIFCPIKWIIFGSGSNLLLSPWLILPMLWKPPQPFVPDFERDGAGCSGLTMGKIVVPPVIAPRKECAPEVWSSMLMHWLLFLSGLMVILLTFRSCKMRPCFTTCGFWKSNVWNGGSVGFQKKIQQEGNETPQSYIYKDL